MRYNIVLIQPPNYPHSMALREIASLLELSFRSLGAQSSFQINTHDPAAINVLVGYHLLTDPSLLDSHGCVIYQLEQLSESEGWLNSKRMEILRRAQSIWDYSADNAKFLQSRGLTDVRHLPIGFHPGLATIRPAAKDIDVLFYGSVNDRRRKILEALNPNCRLQSLFGIYGAERDAYIARSKIILNVHFYEARIMEQPRISYLLNNGCCVVSEDSPHNPFEGMIVSAPYERLVETCLVYLKDDQRREEVAQRGLGLFQQRPMVEYLRQVLAPSGNS